MPEFIDVLGSSVWANLRPADLLDIALVATALYFMFVWVRRRVSRAVGLGLGVVLLAYAAAQLLDLYLTTMAFRVGLTFFLFGLILVFQDDIRRLFERLRAFQFWEEDGGRPKSWSYLDEVVDAVEQMADQRMGALVVMEGDEGIEVHTHGGITLEGEVSCPVLLSIFDPDTDGHDGAVIVDDGRIEKFGVHLPLATDGAKLGAGGARHAAALGLSERSDAFIIVVSEETGRVSIAREGSLETVDSREDLEDQLAGYFDTGDAPDPTPSWKRLLTRNLGLKAASLVLAGLMWLVFANQVATIQRTYTVPIEYRNVPEMMAIEQETTRARLEVVGPERAFRSLNPDALAVSVDVSGTEPGEHSFVLSGDLVALPSELAIRDIQPSRVSATLFRLVETQLPVAVRTVGTPPGDRTGAEITPQPETVTVRVREALKNRITEIPTVPVDLSEIRETTTVESSLVPLPHVRWPEGIENQIQVRIELASDESGESDTSE